MKNLTSVTKHIDFDAAHVLPEGYNGKCRNLHGHTYKAYVTLTGPRDSSEFGMVVDFKLLKEAMKEKNEIKKNAIQMTRAGILQIEKDKGIEVSDEQILGIVAKEVKTRKDSIVEFEKAERQ